MHRKLSPIAFAFLAAAGSGSGFADDITPEPSFTSTRSRAQVMAELQEFQRSGINPWSAAYDMRAGFASAKSRQNATAEYLAAREEVAALTAEDSGSSYLAVRAPALAGPVPPMPLPDDAMPEGTAVAVQGAVGE